MMSLIKPYGKFGFTRPLYGSPPYGMSAGGGFPLTHAKDDLVTHWRTWGDPITDYVTKDGDKRVSVILDQSGEDNDWIQAVGNNQPLWSEDAGDLIGGHEVIKFTTDEFVTCDALATLLSGDEPFTIFAVIQKSDNSAYHFGFFLDGGNGIWHFLATTDDPVYKIGRRNSEVSNKNDASTEVPDTNPHYLSHIFTGTTGQLWLDGTSIIDAFDMEMRLDFNTCTIAARYQNGYELFYEGSIVEFALCHKDLSDARRQAVEAYFASEYGM